MQTGQDAYTAIDIINTSDQSVQINKIIEQMFSHTDGDYFILGETLHDVRSLKKRYKVCLVEDNTNNKKFQIWFAIENLK